MNEMNDEDSCELLVGGQQYFIAQMQAVIASNFKVVVLCIKTSIATTQYQRFVIYYTIP
jgi:hypothetical protein